ncbi:aminotransferase class V-fold PLP-dependent enzyme [Candidatus Bathyarchaeota archaeon]|nr:aminotransferase class V-fold PLP-dependent enzyme [Candidatus Bathyarchaeota archaeon]
MSLREKEDFPLCEGSIYFNNAVIGAVPESTIKVLEEYWIHYGKILRKEVDWESGLEAYKEVKNNCKHLFAEIIGAATSEIAFLPNATTGVNTAFSMIPFEKGDNIVLTDLSFPMCATVAHKQREKGVESRFINHENGVVETWQWEKAVDDDTKVLMVDQAGWFNGYLHDIESLAEIAHEHDAYIIVDGTQSVGAIKWNVHKEDVDFLATSTYKWLLGGPYNNSTGFFYVKEGIQEDLGPDYVGGQTLKPAQMRANTTDGFDLYDYEPREDIGRLEIYNQNEAAYVAVENSMKLLLDFGLENVERQIKNIDTAIIEGLQDLDIDIQTPVDEDRRIYINAKIPEYKAVSEKLSKESCYVSPRVGGLRISPGAYNKTDEAEIFIEKIANLI